MIRGFVIVLVALVLSAAAPPQKRSCAGVTLPEQVVVDGTTLTLNGLGLREATVFDVDVFVAALYVEQRSSDAKHVLSNDARTQVVLHFVRATSAETIVDEMDAGMRENAPRAAKDKKAQLLGWLEDMAVGDTIRFTYVPAKGLEVAVKGRTKGHLTGAQFASAVLSILVGPKTVDPDVRTGLLGGPCS